MSVAHASSSTTSHCSTFGSAAPITLRKSIFPLPTATIGWSFTSGPSLMCSRGARFAWRFTTAAGSTAPKFAAQ